MVLPEEIGDCAQNGDQDRVFAWLDAGGDINDGDPQGCTLLSCCACGSYDDGEIGAPQMALARALLARGADVNRAHSRPDSDDEDALIYGEGDTALHIAAQNSSTGCPDMISLLIDAKANVNATCDSGKTPLWRALTQEAHHRFLSDRNEYGVKLRIVLDIVRVLLRHGASLGCGSPALPNGDPLTFSVEDKLATYKHADDESVIAIKAIVAGVREHGTYKKYMRAPHREFLALRGLAQRGKLSTEHRALNFIAKLGERGVVWHILTYWRPTE